MDGEFVPKKKLTLQVTLETYKRLEELAEARSVNRTKLIDQIVAEAYERMDDND